MRSAKAESYPGAAPWMMHGKLGFKPDGTPGWTPKPPFHSDNVAQELLGNGFNARLSDSISLNRNVSDYRDPVCQTVGLRL